LQEKNENMKQPNNDTDTFLEKKEPERYSFKDFLNDLKMEQHETM
jgi:hypothetical protein